MTDTKTLLLDGAVATLRAKGIAGISARNIAAAAGVNQALVFYHFHSVDELLAAACLHGAQSRVTVYAEQFAHVTTLSELLQVGLDMHEQQKTDGSVLVLAQALAGGQAEPKLAAATTAALELWNVEIEAVLQRVLPNSPLASVLDIPGLARAISSAFIGFELYEGVDQAGSEQALHAIAQLGALVDIIDDLGPAARRLVQAKLRRATHARTSSAKKTL